MFIETGLIKSLTSIDNTITYILSGRNGIEPKSVYCLVEIANYDNDGMATVNSRSEVDSITNKGSQSIGQSSTINVRLTYHGDAKSVAGDKAFYMNMALDSFIGTVGFEQNGFGILDKKDIKVIDVGYETNMFKRYVLDITLLTILNQSFEVDVITKAEIEGEVTIYELPVTFDIDVDVSNYQYNVLLAEDGTTDLTTEKNENIEIVTLGTG